MDNASKEKVILRRKNQEPRKQVPVQRRSLQLASRRQADKGCDLNRTMTLSSSPDVVTSCDPLTLEVTSSENSTDSKRSSASLDDSFGILTPGQMKDFSLTSMTQSATSNCSMVKDISWDDLNTHTVTSNKEDCFPLTETTRFQGDSHISPSEKSTLNSTFTVTATSPNPSLESTFTFCDKTINSLNETFDLNQHHSTKNVNRMNTSKGNIGVRRESIELELVTGNQGKLNAKSERRKNVPNNQDNSFFNEVKTKNMRMFDDVKKMGVSDNVGGGERGKRKRERFSLDATKLMEFECSQLQQDNIKSEGEIKRKMNTTFHISTSNLESGENQSFGSKESSSRIAPSKTTGAQSGAKYTGMMTRSFDINSSLASTRSLIPQSPRQGYTRLSQRYTECDQSMSSYAKSELDSDKSFPRGSSYSQTSRLSYSPTPRERVSSFSRKQTQASAEKIRELFPSISGERSGHHSLLDNATMNRISKSSVDGYFDDIDQELRLRTEQLLKSNSGKKSQLLSLSETPGDFLIRRSWRSGSSELPDNLDNVDISPGFPELRTSGDDCSEEETTGVFMTSAPAPHLNDSCAVAVNSVGTQDQKICLPSASLDCTISSGSAMDSRQHKYIQSEAVIIKTTTPFHEDPLHHPLAPMGNSPRKSSRKPKVGGKKSAAEGEGEADKDVREGEDVSTIETCSLNDDLQEEILPLSCETSDMNIISPTSSKEATSTPPILNHAPTSDRDDSFNLPAGLLEEGVGPAQQPPAHPLCAPTPPGPTSMVVSSVVSSTTNSFKNGNQFLPTLNAGSKVNLSTLTDPGECSTQLLHSDKSAVSDKNSSCQNSVINDKESGDLSLCLELNDNLRKDDVKESKSLSLCDKDGHYDDECSCDKVSQGDVSGLLFNEQCICEDVEIQHDVTSTGNNATPLQHTKDYKDGTKEELEKCDNLSINKSELCSESKVNEACKDKNITKELSVKLNAVVAKDYIIKHDTIYDDNINDTADIDLVELSDLSNNFRRSSPTQQGASTSPPRKRSLSIRNTSPSGFRTNSPPGIRTKSPRSPSVGRRTKSPSPGGHQSVSSRTTSPLALVSCTRSAPNTPDFKRRGKLTNKLLEKVQMQSESLVESTSSQSSQGRGSLFDSQYSTDPQSLVVSVTLSTDMESSGFFSDLDGRISKTETQTLDEIDSIQQDSNLCTLDSSQQDSNLFTFDSVLKSNSTFSGGKDDLSQKLFSRGFSDVNDDTAATITLEDVSIEDDAKDSKDIEEVDEDDLISTELSTNQTETIQIDFTEEEERSYSGSNERKENEIEITRSKTSASTSPTSKRSNSTRQAAAKSTTASQKAISQRTAATNVAAARQAAANSTTLKAANNKALSVSGQARQARVKKPGKWDAIMNRIGVGKKPDEKKVDLNVRGSKKTVSRDLSGSSKHLNTSSQSNLSHIEDDRSCSSASRGQHSDILSPRSDRSSIFGSPKHRSSLNKIGNKENRSKSISSKMEVVRSRSSISSSRSVSITSFNNNNNTTKMTSVSSHNNTKTTSVSSFNNNHSTKTTSVLSTKNGNTSFNSTNDKKVPRTLFSDKSALRKSDNVKRSTPSPRGGFTKVKSSDLPEIRGIEPMLGLTAKRRTEGGVNSFSRVSTTGLSPRVGGASLRNSNSGPGISNQPVKKPSVTRLSTSKISSTTSPRSTSTTTTTKSATTTTANPRTRTSVENNNRKNAKVSRASKVSSNNNNNNSITASEGGQRSSRSSLSGTGGQSKDGDRSRLGHSPLGIASGQPDLLKETIRNDTKLRDNEEHLSQVKQDIRWNNQGFSMMAVVANYYIERHAEAEKRITDLQHRINQIQEESNIDKESSACDQEDNQTHEKAKLDHDLIQAVAAKDGIENEHAEVIKQLQDTIQQLKLQKTQQEADAKSKISELEEEHTKDNNKHKLEFQSLLESRLAEEKSAAESRLQQQVLISSEALQASFEERLTKEKQELESNLVESHLADKTELETRLKQEYTKLNTELEVKLKSVHESEKSSQAKALRQAWEEERNKLEEEEKKKLEERLAEERKKEDLERISEKKTSQSKKVDYRLEAEKERAGRLEQEVESLRTVLEMKTEELHVSRHTRLKLEETIDEYKQKEDVWRRACAQTEDLKVQLNARVEVERRLMEENQRLNNVMEKELNERKRLTMENEQLAWKMKQECENVMSQSLCEGFQYSRVPSGVSRPGSAPPCKNPLASVSLPFMGVNDADGPPDSPRVMEVVEKLESVAWKLEYDLPENNISPGLGRKMSPQSPIFLRKTKSSSLMTRSLDRSGLLTRSASSPQNCSLSHQLLSRSTSIRRKKSPPQFETLSEYTDESDDSKKSPSAEQEKSSNKKQDGGCSNKDKNAPKPVEINDVDDDLCEISSSSEIEIGDSIPDQDFVGFTEEDEDDYENNTLTAATTSGCYDNSTPTAANISACHGSLSSSHAARKLDFKSLQPPLLLEQPLSPGSEELYSPVTEPTLRPTPTSGRRRKVRGQDREGLDTCTSEGLVVSPSGGDVVEVYADVEGDLDSDISESGDELPDSDQAS